MELCWCGENGGRLPGEAGTDMPPPQEDGRPLSYGVLDAVDTVWNRSPTGDTTKPSERTHNRQAVNKGSRKHWEPR